MGAFYANLTLREPEQGQVVEALKRARRSSIVSPKSGDCLAVFDEQMDHQQEGVLSDLASELSKEFDCVALAVLNHDDDVLWYRLYRSAELLDEYNSSPAYFDPTAGAAPPTGGNAAVLCNAFGKDAAVEEVQEILSKWGPVGYIFETDRHRDLVEALGLPPMTVGTGFRDLQVGLKLPTGFVATLGG